MDLARRKWIHIAAEKNSKSLQQHMQQYLVSIQSKNVPCLENASNAERNITATRTKELNSEFFVAEYKAV